MELKGKKIWFLGDSITEGVGATHPDNFYWRVFGRNTGAIVKGYGISGTRVTPLYRDPDDPPSFDQYFRSRVADMEPDADVIVVFGGTNDFGRGDAPLGQMSDRDEGTFYGALHCLYRALLEKYPAAEIVIMTALHRGSEYNIFNDRDLRNITDLNGYVDAIREVAEYYSLPLLDLHKNSTITTQIFSIREKYIYDFLHPTNEGHARVASRLEGFLKTL